MAKKKQPTFQVHVILDLNALNADPQAQQAFVGSVIKMAPQSSLYGISAVQSEVANLGKVQTAYVTAEGTAAASAKQHAFDVTAALTAQIAVNKSLNLIRTLIENNALSVADAHSMAFVASDGKPPPPALLPPESIDVKLGRKGSGKATASAHELGTTRRHYAAQWSPHPYTATSWVNLNGHGKSRKLTGPSGSQGWVQMALELGALMSVYSTPVLITFP